MEHKQKIIAKMDVRISSIAKVKQPEVIAGLFTQHKVLATWDNVLQDFINHEKELSEEVISYLNGGDNAAVLSRTRLPSQGDRRPDYTALASKLPMVTDFDDAVFEQLADANSFWFDDLDLSAHSPKQVAVLVKKRVVRPIKKSFEYLNLSSVPFTSFLLNWSKMRS